MAISAPGLGSGLDVTSIVSKLMEVERLPLNRLQGTEAVIKAEISAYGALKSALSSLQGTLADLKDADTYRATSATSSDDSVLSLSSDTDAVASSYYVTVNRLAQQHKLGSAESAAETLFGGGLGDELTLTAGSESFTLDLSTAMTLSEIQQAINADDNESGISAGLITGDSGNQTLVLTAKESGYDDRVQLSFGGAIGAATFNFSTLNRGSDDQLLASDSELDAALVVDGVSITRGSNSIDDVIGGLTLNLKGEGQASATIAGNSALATNAFSSFISSYNGLRTQMGALASAGFSGRTLLRSIESQVRGLLNSATTGLGDYSYLSELGVTTNSETGDLELDNDMLVTALEDNPESLIGFLTDDDDGFATRFDTLLDNLVLSGGTIDRVIDGANARVKSIDKQQASLEMRLEGIEARYLSQFATLDTLMAEMTTTSNFLTTQLAGLSELFLKRD